MNDTNTNQPTSAEQIQAAVKLIKRALFTLGTQPKPELPETHARIIDDYITRTFADTAWIADVVAHHLTEDPASADVVFLDFAKIAEPAELTILEAARELGYRGDDLERAQAFIEAHVKRNPTATPLLADDYASFEDRLARKLAGESFADCECGSEKQADANGDCADCRPDFEAMARDPEGVAKMRGPAFDGENS